MIDSFSRSVIRLTGQARSFQANIADETVENLVKDANGCETSLAATLYLCRKTKN